MSARNGGAPVIALMLESDGPGGAEVMVLRLAEELRRRGRGVVPVLPRDGCGWLAEQFRAREFDPEEHVLGPMPDFKGVQGLVDVIRRRNVGVVHSHEFALAVLGAAAARLTGRPHVFTMHGGLYYEEKLRRRLALRWALATSRAGVGVSRSTAERIEKALRLRPGRIRVVPNGVSVQPGDAGRVRRELGVASGAGEILMLAVGNLYPVKGHAVLLRAAELLARESDLPPWRLAIAGRGEEEGALRSLAAGAGIKERIFFLGFRDDVPDLLAAADIYVMPSISEGMPLALVEAMSAGKAIVASDVGGIPEVAARGREALLTEPGDPSALAAALASLLREAGLRERLGAAAMERARTEFTVERMTLSYEMLYGISAPAGAPPA